MKRVTVYACVVLLVTVPTQQSLLGQQASGHLVSVQDLHHALAARAAERVRNIEEVRKFLRQDLVQKQVGSLASLEQIEQAIPRLDDETLRQLAEQSRQANDQIEAGLSTGAWVAISVAVAVVVVVLLCSEGCNPAG